MFYWMKLHTILIRYVVDRFTGSLAGLVNPPTLMYNPWWVIEARGVAWGYGSSQIKVYIAMGRLPGSPWKALGLPP